MKNLLYILSKPTQSCKDYEFLLSQGTDSEQSTFILLGGGVHPQGIPSHQFYVLGEDETMDKGKISYREMLNLIFSTDNSVVV